MDPNELRRAAAALGKHLHGLGLDLIPKPTSTATSDWTDRIRVAAEDATVVNADSVYEDSVYEDSVKASPASEPSNDVPPEPATPSTPATTDPRGGAVKASPAAASIAGDAISAGMFSIAASPYPDTSLPIAERQSALESMTAEVANCTRCPQLVAERTQTVFGEGSAAAEIVFFGEAPGADEDRLGRPFVGRAGQLLDKMITACGLSRDSVYIFNTLKCRPPGNRNPQPGEVSNCRGYFETQLELLRPKYIVCLGGIAAQSLLETQQTVGRLRGKFHRYRGSKVLVIYHPAYLLRTPKAKGAAWSDLQLLIRDAELDSPAMKSDS